MRDDEAQEKIHRVLVHLGEDTDHVSAVMFAILVGAIHQLHKDTKVEGATVKDLNKLVTSMLEALEGDRKRLDAMYDKEFLQ